MLATVFVATSCGSVNRTYDTWYKYEHSEPLSLPVADKGNIDQNDSSSLIGNGELKNAELYLRFNATDGLTIRVITKTQQTVSFAGGTYEIQGVNFIAGGEKTYSTKEFGPVRWEALIRLGSFVPEEPPEFNLDISNALAGKFNLKRIIAELLLSWLQ